MKHESQEDSRAGGVLDRVASKWAADLKHYPAEVRREIDSLLKAHASAPFGGLAGEPFVNVLEINLLLRNQLRRTAILTKHRSAQTRKSNLENQ